MMPFELLLLFLLSLLLASLLYLLVRRYALLRHTQAMMQIIGAASPREGEGLLKEQQRRRIHMLQERLERYLRLAGLSMPLSALVVFCLLGAALLSVLFYLYLKSYAAFALGLLLAGVITYMLLETMTNRRRRAFNLALASAITVLVKMMKNGIGFEQALGKSIDVSTCTLFKELFTRFLHEKNTIGEESAFSNMERHIDSKELRIFAIAVKIGRASGGRFSQTLEKVEQTIRYRKRMSERIGVITREASVGSYIIAAIGIVLYFMLDFNFNGKVSEYFFTAPYGRWQLLGIVAWVALGLLVNKLITRIRV